MSRKESPLFDPDDGKKEPLKAPVRRKDPVCGMALEPVAPIVPVSRTEWTCPMHPEVVRDAPGSCPRCGMALEPRDVTLEEEESEEFVDMRRRFG